MKLWDWCSIFIGILTCLFFYTFVILAERKNLPILCFMYIFLNIFSFISREGEKCMKINMLHGRFFFYFSFQSGMFHGSFTSYEELLFFCHVYYNGPSVLSCVLFSFLLGESCVLFKLRHLTHINKQRQVPIGEGLSPHSGLEQTLDLFKFIDFPLVRNCWQKDMNTDRDFFTFAFLEISSFNVRVKTQFEFAFLWGLKCCLHKNSIVVSWDTFAK